MKRYLLLLVGMVCLLGEGQTQKRYMRNFDRSAPGLSIGDKVPEVNLERMLNYPKRTAKFSDFRGKWLIIDLYATWCTACLTVMPKLQELRNKYADQLEVLVVTHEPEHIIEAFRAKNKVLRAINLPFLTEDSVLNQLFPHREIPHEVWIDPEGVVRAITDADDVREENLEAMLAGKKVEMRVKKEIMNYGYKDPLPTGDTDFVYRSLLSKRKGVSISYVENNEQGKKIRRLMFPDRSATGLFYQAAYVGRFSNTMNKKLIVLETKERDKWLTPDSFPTENFKTQGDWSAAHAYCYELILPQFVPAREAYSIMLQDLNRTLPIKGQLEKRPRTCWVIYNSKKSDDSFASGGGKLRLGWSGGVLQKAEHMPFDDLINSFNNNRVNMDPIVNETGYHGPVSMELNLAMYNTDLSIPDLKKALNRYGLEIKRSERMVDVLVIRDK